MEFYSMKLIYLEVGSGDSIQKYQINEFQGLKTSKLTTKI